MRLISKVIFLFLVSLLASCFANSRETVSEQELIQFMLQPPNGLMHQMRKGGLEIDIIYKPRELVLAGMMRDQSFNFRQVDSLRKELNNLNYILIRLSRNGVEAGRNYVADPVQYNQLVTYLTTDIVNNVRLRAGSDTLHVYDLVHTNTLGHTSTDILFTFKNNSKEDGDRDMTFMMNDDFFGIGFIESTFSSTDIANIPPLMLK